MSKLCCWVIRETFHLLQEYDPELEQFFKIRADFASAMPRTVKTNKNMRTFWRIVSPKKSSCLLTVVR
jgi:hypothetical protein